MAEVAQQKIVVIGAGGRLGCALVRELGDEFDLTGFTRTQLDLASPNELRASLGKLDFDLLINAAALTNVDYCEDHRAEAMRINAEAPQILAAICQEKTARFLQISTDYVFDGEKHEPYREEDAAEPLSVYGESKREGERLVLNAAERALVLRVSWVFGPDRPSFIDAILKKARTEAEVTAVADKFSTPTYTKDIAEMLRPLLKDSSVSGLLHLAGRGACSWQQYAQWALDCCHRFNIPMRARKVGASSLGEMKSFIARRPVYTVLGTAKYEQLTGTAPRDWHEAVADYVRDYYQMPNE